MNSRDRVLCSLSHREPDRVPLDIGGSDVTGIHRDAYRNLARLLGIQEEVAICEIVQQVALPSEEMLQKLEVDVRPIYPNPPDRWQLEVKDDGAYRTFVDEWGVEWAMPKKGGLYFDMISHPLSDVSGVAELSRYPWPDGANRGRFKGLREYAQDLAATTQAAITMVGLYGGIFESAFWLRGYQNFFMDLAYEPVLVEAVLDATLRFRLDYWAEALEEMGDLIDVVVEYDDLGHMSGLLISPEMYRRYVKPRHKELFDFIKGHSQAAVFLHTCGSVYGLIPDLIEAGVDILNPLQVSAAKMGDTRRLKREFGAELTFWGGGVDTQGVLPRGTVEEVKEEVERRIADLAPGGGFLFAAVHNIQPDVPPQNIMAMWEAWKEHSSY